MTKGLKVGDKLPKFLLKDHLGFDVSNEAILGSSTVIYFYPKDETPGCTDEACSFRDARRKFDKLQALIVGISPDSVESHKKFIDKHSLGLSLLCDENKEMCAACGVLDDKGHVVRSTFIVDTFGKVVWIEKPVDVKGHVERVLKAIEEHCKEDRLSLSNLEIDYENFLQANLTTTPDQKKLEAEILKKYGIKKSDPKNKK